MSTPTPQRSIVQCATQVAGATERKNVLEKPGLGALKHDDIEDHYEMAEASSSSLTDTLLLALTQSQQQIQTIQRQALQIEQLQRENEELRKELSTGRSSDAAQAREASAVRAQAQDLFQQNTNAQAEIKRLHKRLNKYKDKINARLQVPLSSPVTSSPEPTPPSRPPSLSEDQACFESPDRSRLRKRACSPSSSSRKRSKPDLAHKSDVPTQISNSSVDSGRSSIAVCRVLNNEQGKMVERFARGSSEDHIDPYTASTNLGKDNGTKSGVHDRLDALLTTSRPSKSPITRLHSSNSGSIHSHPMANMTLESPEWSRERAANQEDTDSNVQSLRQPKHSGRIRIRGDGKTYPSPLTIEDSVADENAVRPFKKLSSGEPLRRRPLQDLSLHHFKLNARALSNSHIAIDGMMDYGHGERTKALMQIDSYGPHSSGPEVSLSDYEVLLEFLGTGSEAQIARLSLRARSELLSKARRAQAAKSLAPQTNEHGLHDDAPGFWSADMPATQEDIKNKMVAKQRERREVELRYHDAMTSRDRWMFVDE